MRNERAVVAFVFVLLASFAVMSAYPASGLLQACVQEAVLALVGFVAVAYAQPTALKRCAFTVQQRNATCFLAGSLLLVGFIGGVISLVTWCIDNADTTGLLSFSQLISVGEIARNLLLLLGVCIFTGAYEEAFMRVLGIEAFERVLDARRAILTSALLFALLHVGVPDTSAGQVVLVQSVLKFVQALLFGAILGALYARTRRLWPCALLHAGFDTLYLGSHVLLAGALPATYASGAAGDTVLLAVTVVLLMVIAVVLVKKTA